MAADPLDLERLRLRLMTFIREQVDGGCRILSLGDACECPRCDVDRLVAEVRALREQVKGLGQALEDITNPIAAFQREAEKTGGSLTGAAYYLSNDPNYLKTIARDALREVRDDA